MKKIIFTTSLILAFGITFGQSDKSKKVKSKYINFPSYNVSENFTSDLTVSFASSDIKIEQKKLKDTKSKCVQKGKSIKEGALVVTAYHYEIPYTSPEYYVVAKSADDKIVYAFKENQNADGKIRFGYDYKMEQSLCEYWQLDALKKDWENQQEKYLTGQKSKIHKKQFGNAADNAKNDILIKYVNQEFSVYTAKGKGFDYSRLDLAFDNALKAYNGIRENGYNQNDLSMLKECVSIWEKELKEVNLDDKKARINKSIAKGLEENCAIAYFYLMDYENATIHSSNFNKLFGNMGTTRLANFKLFSQTVTSQSICAAKNEELVNDLAKLKEVMDKNYEIQINDLGISYLDSLKSDYNKYVKDGNAAYLENMKQQEADLIEKGELNPYQKYYMTAMAGGEGIMMNMAPSQLSGIPELKEFPKEICLFTEAKQVMILNNKIESIPSEIANMSSLRKLDLTGNNISELPAEIGSLENLEVLKLGKNPLVSLPKELNNCTKLKSLNLKGTKVPESQIKEFQKVLPNCKIKF